MAGRVSWSYVAGDTGPEHWATDYPHCGDSSQSPINIKTAEVVQDSNLTPFTFTNYDSTNSLMTLTNNGHSAKVDLPGQAEKISGGGLTGEYKILQFHFHWGSSSSQGSEHKINAQQYPLEMHIVHVRVGMEDPLHTAEGLAVLGILFQVGETVNTNYDKVFSYLNDTKHPGSSKSIPPFAVQDLLPSSTDKFWRYSGSLTTPSCDESVVWTVFQEYVSVSEAQLQQLRSLEQTYNSQTIPLVDNFRPIQNTNGRVVKSS